MNNRNITFLTRAVFGKLNSDGTCENIIFPFDVTDSLDGTKISSVKDAAENKNSPIYKMA